MSSDEFLWVPMGSDEFRWVSMGSDDFIDDTAIPIVTHSNPSDCAFSAPFQFNCFVHSLKRVIFAPSIAYSETIIPKLINNEF